MSALVELTQFGARTNSRVVAEVFEKEHKNVLAAIDDIVGKKPELIGLNFQPNVIKVKTGFGGGREVRAFEMDRDGFTLVAMGFTGVKALDWKLAFIEAFNRMEAAVLAPPPKAELAVLEDFAPGLALIREARQIFPPAVVRKMWVKVGLPDPYADDGCQTLMLAGAKVDDSVAMWFGERAAVAPGGRVKGSALFEDYTRWAAVRGLPSILDAPGFGRSLTAMGIPSFLSNGTWRSGITLVDS